MLPARPVACSSADFSSKARIESIDSSASVTSRSTTVSNVVTGVSPFDFRNVGAGKEVRLLRVPYKDPKRSR
jgi:hypothetical protein